MAKQKIKKTVTKSKNPFEFWGLLNNKERVLVVAPVIALVCVAVAFFAFTRRGVDTARGTVETKLVTDGDWTSFGSYGIDVWAPSELSEEKIEGERADYCKLYATRDKGSFPEITVGSFVVPETISADFTVADNVNDIVEMVRPYIYEEFVEMFNGVAPALIGDYNVVEVDGESVLEFSGTGELTVVYKDPTGKRDNGEPYSELTDTNIYYMVRPFNNHLVCVWGTWDYSTYEGEERVKNSVKDGIVSLFRTGDALADEGISSDSSSFEDSVVKEEGISEEDKASGLETVPYQGEKGTQWDDPIGSDGNSVDVEDWAYPEGEPPVTSFEEEPPADDFETTTAG